MSKIAIKSSSSGTATFTIESPSTNTDRTFNLPDSAGTVATAESTLAQFNVTGSAPVFACRAFVNFNGIGTVAIRASGNVSSVTKNSPGDYTVNLTTALPDANYAVNVTPQNTVSSDYGNVHSSGINSASARVSTFRRDTGVTADVNAVHVTIFR